MAAYYVVKGHKDGSAVVTSVNDHAKQVFFGWGGPGVNMQFYGSDTGSWGAGHKLQWRWDLTAGGVHEMIRCLRDQLAPLAGKALSNSVDREVKPARELLRKLEKVRDGAK